MDVFYIHVLEKNLMILGPCLPGMGAPKAVERTRGTLRSHNNYAAAHNTPWLGRHPILDPDDTSK